MPYTSPVKFGRLVLEPVVGVIPGRSRSTSAALVPTMGVFSICSAVSVALFSPELSGVSATSALTDTVSAMVATLRTTCRTVRLSPPWRTRPVTSYELKPEIATLTL